MYRVCYLIYLLRPAHCIDAIVQHDVGLLTAAMLSAVGSAGPSNSAFGSQSVLIATVNTQATIIVLCPAAMKPDLTNSTECSTNGHPSLASIVSCMRNILHNLLLFVFSVLLPYYPADYEYTVCSVILTEQKMHRIFYYIDYFYNMCVLYTYLTY